MLKRESLTHISELRGSFPEIPLPDGMLEQFGDDAMFVTLPIGKVDARSRNGRTYTREAVQAIVDAVNRNKPEGRWGHLRDEDRPYTYEAPAMRWLVALMDGDGVAWAKGVPVTAEAREHFRIAKIAGSRVGTSIYGFGQMDGDRVVDFELETIDLAAPDRVGIPETASQPLITKEIHDGDDDMTTIELKDVPENVRLQIIEQNSNSNNSERISEMKTQLTGLQTQVAELTGERDAARGEASTLLAGYGKAQIAEAVQLEPVRRLVERMVGIKETDDGATVDGVSSVAELDAKLKEALDDKGIQAFNKDSLKEMMGPDWKPPANGQQNNQDGVLGPVIPS